MRGRALRRSALAAGCGALLAGAALLLAARSYEAPGPARRSFAKGFELVGYHALEDRPAFKLALQVVDGRWYLYTSHFWDSGWSVLEVTDPAHPELLAFVPGPPNTATLQVQVADGLLLAALEEPATELLHFAPWRALAWLLVDSLLHGPRYLPWRPSGSGVLVFDVHDPARPVPLG